ncbi:MAG: hypothetical protein WDN48_01045 [Pseudolabrys sp.]
MRRLKANTAGVPIAIATALANPNHIALARLTRHAGGDVKVLKIEGSIPRATLSATSSTARPNSASSPRSARCRN